MQWRERYVGSLSLTSSREVAGEWSARDPLGDSARVGPLTGYSGSFGRVVGQRRPNVIPHVASRCAVKMMHIIDVARLMIAWSSLRMSACICWDDTLRFQALWTNSPAKENSSARLELSPTLGFENAFLSS